MISKVVNRCCESSRSLSANAQAARRQVIVATATYPASGSTQNTVVTPCSGQTENIYDRDGGQNLCIGAERNATHCHGTQQINPERARRVERPQRGRSAAA